MQDDRFEWDDDKARTNSIKHKVAFETACLVFDDPGTVDDPDDSMDYGEERYRAVGMVNGLLIAVLYTLRGERIRIISARPASRTESNTYVRYNPPR